MDSDTTENDHKNFEFLKRDLLGRRTHYGPSCRYIAVRRNDLYNEIPINLLIPLAFHTTTTLLESSQNINALVQAVSDRYKSDLFSDWQRYCKALKSEQRAVAIFEGAIYFAAQSISESEERENWTSSCRSHLPLLEQLSDRSRKRKRRASQADIETTEAPAARFQPEDTSSLDLSLSQTSIELIDQGEATEKTSRGNANASIVPQVQDSCQIEASDTNIAMMAYVDKLESTLGGYLFKGMNASRMRKGEKDRRMITLTDTVRLHLAHQEGEDFKLEVWLCSLIGKAILQVKIRSVEELRSMLGDYLFNAMKASNWRQGEKKTGISDHTTADNVSFHDSDDGSDCKVEVMLNFRTGTEVYENIYPRVS